MLIEILCKSVGVESEKKARRTLLFKQNYIYIVYNASFCNLASTFRMLYEFREREERKAFKEF
jgi:hypothetical protein